MTAAADTSRISPTAHYTSYVWFANGMSYEALATRKGRIFYRSLQPMNLVSSYLTPRPSLEEMLLARHRVIDHRLQASIESGEVGQVVEVAAGLSPRGVRFAERYRERGLCYVEGDLPDMAARKRAALDQAGLRGPGHHVVTLNALASSGPGSLAAVADTLLDPARGTAIVTEGLLSYFPRVEVEGMWRRFATCLRGFPHGLYLSSLSVEEDFRGYRAASAAFRALLGAFAGGRVHLHYRDGKAAAAALRASGFAEATVHRPEDFRDQLCIPGRRHFVRVLEGRSGPAA